MQPDRPACRADPWRRLLTRAATLLTRAVAPLLTRAAALLLGLAPAVGCGDEAPPPPGARAGRPELDAGKGDSGAIAAPSPRPPPGIAPRLPLADHSLELPFGGPGVRHRIEIEAAPRSLDLVFNVDTTGSMGGEIEALQQSLSSIVAPALVARVPDVSFGVARFEDFPEPPWGSAATDVSRADEPFRLVAAVTSDLERVTSALASLDRPLGAGGDVPESGAEALWQLARGDGYRVGSDSLIARYAREPQPGGGDLPGAGFRDGALRAVMHVTDAPSHDPSDYGSRFPGTHDLGEAAVALLEADVRVLSILSTPCLDPDAPSCDTAGRGHTRAELVALATTTGALGDPTDGQCPYGVRGRAIPAIDDRCPLVFEVASTGEGLSEALVDAVVALVDATRFEHVTAAAAEDPIGFVRSVEPLEIEGGPEPRDELPEDEPDGELDSFTAVKAGQPLAFEVTLQNRAVPARDFEQRFRVVVEVRGDGLVLERLTLRVIVPAAAGLVPDAAALADQDAGKP